VLTVHDLTCVRYPELCTRDTLQYPRLIRRALARGAVVHAVSEHVADDVRAYFDVPSDRVVTIYAGLVPTAGGNVERGHRLAGGNRYVLALGTIEPRKNLPALVRAFDLIAGREHDLRLVVAGPDGWGRDAFVAARDAARSRDRIVRLGYVSDEDRPDLLAGASVYAYPSLYEGFGHPPLEAMAAGVPVVAARAGALPEVLGDAALLVEPADVDELAAALERAVGDTELRACLAERGLDRAGGFTWDRAASEFAVLYRSLAGAA
jgi:glycosyltransferase involved in cell wall biosynthesis